jgi:predicted Ser/Thr protein kinase
MVHDDNQEKDLKKIHLIHGAHSTSQADIWLVERQGKQCVLRDYSKPRPWFLRLLCRWALRRETQVHRLLQGVPGIPEMFEILDRDRYLIEYIEGKPLSTWRETSPGLETIRQLEVIIREMHKRRVAHGDIRNKNILIAPDGRPYLIDFSTAWWGTTWWRRPLFRFYRMLDRQRLAISKVKFAPTLMNEEEKNLVNTPPFYLRLGRFYRHGLYQFIRKGRINSRERSR